MPLETLKPGQRFQLSGEPVTGTLVSLTRGAATVRLDGGERDVAFTDRNGQERRFHALQGRVTQWSLRTSVQLLETP